MTNGGDRTGGSRRRDVRRARKLARERQRAWDAIRAEQEIGHAPGTTPRTAAPQQYGVMAPDPATTAPHVPPTAFAHATAENLRRPALLTRDDTGPASADRAARRGSRGVLGDRAVAVVHPALTTLLAVVAVVGGSPVVAGAWDLWWAVGAGIPALGLLVAYPRTWRRSRGTARLVGAGLALLLLFGAGVGVLRQNVVEGRAQLRGSALDLAVDEHAELTRALRVLSENQRLLSLPPEQAIPLGDVYAGARGQAIAIGERWNPATAAAPPVAELGEVYTLVNLAAAQQAAALDVFVANLENPEPALADEVVERGNVVAALVTADIPAALSAADAAIRAAARGGAR